MATSPTMRKLLALVHEYGAEPAPVDSDAAAERDLDYFDRILGLHPEAGVGQAAPATTSEYRIRRKIDLYAVGHLDAARQARHIQLRPESLATVFDVLLRGDTDTEMDWSKAETIDLTAHRSDPEVLDEIADLLLTGELPTAAHVAHITRLIQLTGRPLSVPATSDRSPA